MRSDDLHAHDDARPLTRSFVAKGGGTMAVYTHDLAIATSRSRVWRSGDGSGGHTMVDSRIERRGPCSWVGNTKQYG